MKAASRVKTHKRRVNMSLDAPDAKKVSLVCDFNAWDPKKHPMKKSANGLWQKTIYLTAPGTYEYKFHVDGQWVEDPGNQVLCDNRFGTRNNIITVAPRV